MICWFLKENSRNYGQGIWVTSTLREALDIAAAEEADEQQTKSLALRQKTAEDEDNGEQQSEPAPAPVAEEEEEEGRTFVIQPHIPRPLLIRGCKFHIRIYCMIMFSPSLRFPRNLVYGGGKLSIAGERFDVASVDKSCQVTTARSPDVYTEWEHFQTVQPVLIDMTRVLLDRMEPLLGPQPWSGRCGFELLGLDYMVCVPDCLPAPL